MQYVGVSTVGVCNWMGSRDLLGQAANVRVGPCKAWSPSKPEWRDKNRCRMATAAAASRTQQTHNSHTNMTAIHKRSMGESEKETDTISEMTDKQEEGKWPGQKCRSKTFSDQGDKKNTHIHTNVFLIRVQQWFIIQFPLGNVCRDTCREDWVMQCLLVVC